MKHFIDLNSNLQKALVEMYGEDAKSSVYDINANNFQMFTYVREFKLDELDYFDLDRDTKAEIKPSICGVSFSELMDQLDNLRVVMINQNDKLAAIRVK